MAEGGNSDMVRKATIADIPAMEKMGESFYKYGGFERYGLSYTPDAFKKVLTNLIESPDFMVLVCEKGTELVGSIAGVFGPWLTDPSQNILTELWWWVDVEKHGQGVGTSLIQAFEREAVMGGSVGTIMVTLAGPQEDKLKSVYTKMGYSHLEAQYFKGIGK